MVVCLETSSNPTWTSREVLVHRSADANTQKLGKANGKRERQETEDYEDDLKDGAAGFVQ